MQSTARGWAANLAATSLVAGMLFGTYYLGTTRGDLGAAGQGLPSPAAVTLASDTGNARVEKERGLFAELAKKLKPTVVHIQVTTREAVSEVSPFDDMPEEFRRFFGPHGMPQHPGLSPRPGRPTPPSRESQGQGSGVVISPDGFILTNNHVVRGATDIQVIFEDERELKGRVVGTDPKTDLAVIKVESPLPLQAAELGDSDAAEVGDWVMAIGNPFGLSHTVTVGVVSGKGRVIGMDQYDQFIQTDASINPGNSGGPLFDTGGRVIGINTAIISHGQGIGFAVPVNLARQVAEQLRAHGEVVRGFVGLQIQPVTPKMARALNLPEGTTGALVGGVVPGGPGDKAGVQAGDVVVEFNGRKLKDEKDLLNAVAGTAVDSRASLTVLREGRTRTLSLTVAKRPSEDREIGSVQAPETHGLGLAVRDIGPQIAEQLGVPAGSGVVVTSVEPGSAADKAGLRQGDVIRRVGSQEVKSVRDFERLARGKDPLALLVVRDRGQMFVVVEGDAG